MEYKLVSKTKLIRTNTQVLNEEEGKQITSKLLEALTQFHENKIPLLALSAPMIGICKRVIVTMCNGSEPKVFINPEIIEKSQDLVFYVEHNPCVSSKHYKTIRSRSITVKDSSTNYVRIFSNEVELKEEKMYSDLGLRECVLLQEQIELLNNVLLCNNSDIKVNKFVKKEPIQKYGRNDKVYIEKDGESQFIKYKLAIELINKENWKLI